MLQDLGHLLAGFWTWQTPLSFLAGVGAHHIYCKTIRDREGPVFTKKKTGDDYRLSTRFWIVAVIAAVVIGWIGWRTQDTADKVEEQATATSECLSKVIASLDARTKINAENDNLSQVQRTAFGEVLRAIVSPPENLSELAAGSLERQAYVEQVVRQQFAIVEDAQAQQEANEKDRAEHPYPPADCSLVNR